MPVETRLAAVAAVAALLAAAATHATAGGRQGGHAFGQDRVARADPPAAARAGGHALGPDTAALRSPLGCPVGIAASVAPCEVADE